MNKWIYGALGVVVVAGGAYAAYRAGYLPMFETREQKAQPVVTQAVPGDAYRYEWMFTTQDGPDGTPQTIVALKVGDTTYDAGTYTGSCSEISTSTSWTLLPNEQTGAICWFAGGGDEVGVFSEGGKTLVKKGQLDEGSAEVPGSRGNFTELFAL